MKVITQTTRLILRELELNDSASLYHLNSDPDVLKYTGDVAFKSKGEARAFLENYPDYRINNFGRWAVIEKERDKFIGWCGLKKHNNDMVDLGFRFFKNEWNKGYASESALASIEYGFNELGLNEIVGRAAMKNKASIRVLEKIGMGFWKIDTCEGIENAAYYFIKKEDWNQSSLPVQ